MQQEVLNVRNGGKPQTGRLRAWIREADRTIRANNEVYGVLADTEEDQPWLKRVWQNFLRPFTAK